MNSRVAYRVGIDVGTHSVGFAAVGMGEAGLPIELLNCLSLIHDSGIDPGGRDKDVTRLAASGIARRTRRLLHRRRRRLINLDRHLESLGWPLVNLETERDPYLPWKVRAELASFSITDESERARKLSIALRHMARHRGWRNPYTDTVALLRAAPPSESFAALLATASKAVSRPLPADLTVGQVVAATSLTSTKLRGEGGILASKLMQIDHANEIRQIAKVQGLSDPMRDALILHVFAAESPKGSAEGRVGKDPLPGQSGKLRAPKAHEEFQRYRMVSLVANLRVRAKDVRNSRPLSAEERTQVIEYLTNLKPTINPAWPDIAEALEIPREHLIGTAKVTSDGERAASRPPVNVTDRVIRTCKVKPVAAWWISAPLSHRAALVEALSNGGSLNEDEEAGAAVDELLRSLSPDDLGALDGLHLPGGRAAYSVDSLRRMTAHMLSTTDDLHATRMSLFGVEPDWAPPAEPIQAPVGNPAVDRVLKAVGRWLLAVEREWGAPESITIEHVRSGLASQSMARELDRANNRRAERNQKLVAEIHSQTGASGQIRRSDVMRFQAVTRQNCQCAYCGETISYETAELDHIVPRMGPGSTNTRTNLLAACRPCNRSKSNIPFAVWATQSSNPEISVAKAVERTRHWPTDSGLTAREFNRFKQEVVARLRRTEEDPEIDSRSMESVAWMANELRTRVEQHFRSAGADTEVRVFRGRLTSEARKASGIERQIPFIGETGKTRLDRRHHAVDAAVLTMMDPMVARILAERTSLRDAQRLQRNVQETWKAFQGATPNAQASFSAWQCRMTALLGLISEAMEQDRIPVTENLRLRFGNSAVHEAKIHSFRPEDIHSVGGLLSVETIDRASTPGLWCALIRHPQFDPVEGLPENPSREIRLHGTKLGSSERLSFFPTSAGYISLRGGYAKLGEGFHHARIYRIEGNKPSFAMMRVYTHDLTPHRDKNLFEVEILPQTISHRTTESKLRKAIAAGTATYLGWIVIGDELEVDMTAYTSGHIGEFMSEYPGTTRWRLDGFESESTFRLRPALLAAEGLKESASGGVRNTMDSPGWRPAINKLISKGFPVVVRRTSLGIPRTASSSGLPVSWKIR